MSEIINTPEVDSSAIEDPNAAVEAPAYLRRRSFGQLFRGDLGFIPVLVTLIIIIIFFQIITNGLFFNLGNLTNLFLQNAQIGLCGLGVILVLLLGEIDLSVAAVSTFCGVVMGVLSERLGLPPWLSITGGLLAGALAGFINGFFIAVLRIPSFIVTLAASISYSGLLITLLNNQATLLIQNSFIVSLAGSPKSYFPDILGIGLPTAAVLIYILYRVFNYRRRASLGLRNPAFPQFLAYLIIPVVLVEGLVIIFESNHGVPYSSGILFGAIVLFWILLTKTSWGRHVYAVGGNKEAARRAGISIVAIQLTVFTLCSALAAVGGIIEASYTFSATTQVSPFLLLNAIAAAVIGGVSLFGGRGSVWAIVLGMLIIGSLSNGLALKNLGTDALEIIEGLVLLAAVTADALIRRLQMRTGR